MRIFTPDLKTVRELTRYISPSEIERARFKKYNQPVINDGNIACDEFFRCEELFDRKNDIALPSYRSYSTDDIPAIDRWSLHACDERRIGPNSSSYVESVLPYYVDIIGTNERVYLESYGVKNPKYPHEEMAGEDYPDLTVDEVVNINYHIKSLIPGGNTGAVHHAYNLIRSGFPLEGVVNIIRDSATRKANGEVIVFEPVLFDFLSQFPTLRKHVVSKSLTGKEVLDRDAAMYFPKLVSCCKDDIPAALQIVKDCREEIYDGSFCCDERMLKMAKNLFCIDGKWTKDKAEIVDFIKKYYYLAIGRYTGRVNNMIKDDYTVKDIMANLKASCSALNESE